jgi:hypothetical protein
VVLLNRRKIKWLFFFALFQFSNLTSLTKQRLMKLTFTFFACLIITGSFGILSFRPETKSKMTAGEYNAQLISSQQAGTNYEWVWSVTNPNPGNGTNGTLQNLSHWSLAISDLVALQDIVSVAYSTDGINWVSLPVSFAIDKSQECYRGTVLKFDHGTSGSEPMYYQLVLNKDFTTGYTTANFKSGNTTGCYNGTVLGIGAPSGGDGTSR